MSVLICSGGFYLDAAEQVFLSGRGVFSLDEAKQGGPSSLRGQQENVTSTLSDRRQRQRQLWIVFVLTFSFLLGARGQLHLVPADGRRTVRLRLWGFRL